MNILAGLYEYTSLFYGLYEADEGRGSSLWWCELLAQVRHRNSWNNNTNLSHTATLTNPAVKYEHLEKQSTKYVHNMYKTYEEHNKT